MRTNTLGQLLRMATLSAAMIAGGAATRIIIDGDYVPPGGIFGMIFDILFGRWIAHASVHDLIRRLADDLNKRELAWRSRHGAA